MTLHLCFTKIKYCAFICIIVGFAGCDQNTKKQTLRFEVISDSFYKPDDNYKQALSLWKNYYEHCMNQQLFADAFYLQLQDKMNIGSINNEHEMDVNKGLKILDTSNNQNIFNLLAVMNSANCSDTILLNNNLRKDFYAEVIKALSVSPEYKDLPAIFDSEQMNIRVGTLFYDALRPDSLISKLNRTNDSSVIRYKELLLRPENALLAETVDVLGFNADFPLKKKLSPQQEEQLIKGVSFKINASSDNIKITLFSNTVRCQVNKRYSVLGKFLKLKAE